MTFRDNEIWKAVVALIIGILAGTVVSAIAAFQQAPKDDRPSGWKPYVINFRTLATVGAGVVAAITTYGKLVEGDPTWDATTPALLALATATFAAALAAKTFADLKGPTKKEKDKGLAS